MHLSIHFRPIWGDVWAQVGTENPSKYYQKSLKYPRRLNPKRHVSSKNKNSDEFLDKINEILSVWDEKNTRMKVSARSTALYPQNLLILTQLYQKIREILSYISTQSTRSSEIRSSHSSNFSIAKDIDADYAKALKTAVKNNLNLLCYDCKFSSKGIKLNKKIKIKI